jgi:hypothetical protein
MEAMRKVRNSDNGNSASDALLGAASDVPFLATVAAADIQPQAAVEGRLARQLIRITEPGIYRDFDGDSYFADPCIDPSLSQSIAKVLIAQSAAHAKVEHPRLTPPSEDDEAEKYVKAQAIGNASHKMVLGRGKEIEVIDRPDFKSQGARDLRDAAMAAGRVPILSKHMADASKMVDALRLKLAVHDERDAFTKGSSEVMIVWQEDGIWFRSLIDWLSDDLRTIDDYKSTALSIAPHNIGKVAVDAGWHVQMAFIERGLDVLDPAGAGRRRFRNIAQENYAPFEINVMVHDEHWLTMGRKNTTAAINRWRDAIETGRWTGYPRKGITPEYPSFAESKFLDRETNGEFEPAPRAKQLQSLMGG